MSKKASPLPSRSPGWKFDLPVHGDIAWTTQKAKGIQPPPNHYNNIYLELPRSSVRIRGISALLGILLFSTCTLGELCFIYLSQSKSHQLKIEFSIISFVILISLQWLTLSIIRMDVELPRDEPIRFNRLRRKVYVYQFKLDRFRVFSRRRWGVQPEVYDWDDLHAEACSIYLPMGNGGLIENIIISVRKPGTDEVIDRFFFSHDWVEGQAYWTIAQLFMEQGPQALPEFVHPPRDWNNEPTAFDFIPHFAPKVQWPKEMDLESRSAPFSGETS
ncbi:DUF6708 domain-containing protein [Pseudomonas guariconensis]|uniref:DUF6708 domain-containing protein n=1 Tax=Pseudomonas guariconensis TaxID=1288410 RepID=UPI002E248104